MAQDARRKTPQTRLRLLAQGATLGLGLCLLLAACGEPQSGQVYRVSGVQPFPARPGETLTVFGKLPKTLTVTLGSGAGSVPLDASPVVGGFQVTLPPQVVAGEHTLRLSWPQEDDEGKTGLSTPLVVQPRLDTASLEGNTVRVSGAGWPQSPSELTAAAVRLEAGGISSTPTLEGGFLLASLPTSLPNGSLSVSVWVNGQGSNALTLVREAGAARGTVVLPASQGAQGRALNAQGQWSEAKPRNPTALIVHHAPGALDHLSLPGVARLSLPLAGGYSPGWAFPTPPPPGPPAIGWRG